MSPDESFSLFPVLPAEIRFQIWEIALSTFIVVHLGPRPPKTGPERRIMSTDHSFIGQSCKEARKLMRITHCRVPIPPTVDTAPYGAAWVNFSQTTFLLGFAPPRTLDCLRIYVESVLLRWASYGLLIHSCKTLLASYPALREIIVLVPLRGISETQRRSVPTALDLHDMASQISRKTSIQGLPALDTKHLKFSADEFLTHESQRLGRAGPHLEIVVSEVA
ncbi:hypothetical protein G7Y89_g11128 [Cudoniella acicularis]|uniref:2EXR domain-containing protein n=1 Tax=Cudoniella acicularis TaxID=354080 RepID=A0A8H4W0X9_9HELO|nr:hypothetical protein G7Y89_g11128 [Cudoniella acicularis]